MATTYLTDRWVKTIESANGRAEAWDSVVPGLGLRYSGRKKSWFFVYHSPKTSDAQGQRRRRLTLGHYPAMSLEAARGQAANYREQIRNGRDPGVVLEPTGVETLLFRDLAERHFQSEAKSPTQKHRYAWALRSLVPAFGDRLVVSIRRSEVVEYLTKVRARGPAVAKLQLASLRRILQWGVEQFDLPANPARGIVLEPVPSRERVLSSAEVAGLWRGCEQYSSSPMSVLLRLRLATAQRGAQLLRMNLSQLERTEAGVWWNVPSGITKTGKPSRVFLSPLAERILATLQPSADGCIFGLAPIGYFERGALTRRVAPLRRYAPGDWRPADLRRTAATWMAQRGVPRFVVKRVLGHADRDITAVYDRYSYDREVKAAVLILEQAIREAIGEAPPAVPIVEPVTFPLSGPSPSFPQFPGLPR